MTREIVPALILLVAGALALTATIFVRQDHIDGRETSYFSLNCSINKILPIFLQSEDKFEFYIVKDRNYNSPIKYELHDPTGQIVLSSVIMKYSNGSESHASELTAKKEGFYTLNFTNINCDNIIDKPLILSTIIKTPNKLDAGSLQNLGSILIGLSGGYLISIIQQRLRHPLNGSKI